MAELQDARVHHMKVTSAGQISLPAEVRRRWGASRVRVTDEGGRLVIEPASDHPLSAAIGLLAGGRGASDGLLAERMAEREQDATAWSGTADGGNP